MRSTAPKNAASRELENPEEYITGFGKMIRMTSIDELPQLFNILRGDMSIIGPRPLVYTEREIRFLRRYYGLYQVRPGLSGMAQINGRDYVSIYVKVAYDRKYMETIGFKRDVKLVLKTIYVVLGRIGIAEGKHAKTEDEDKMLDLLLDEEQRRTEAVNV